MQPNEGRGVAIRQSFWESTTMIALAWLCLVLYTTVVSQPLFYGLALGRAANALSGAAYVELRQQINAAIAKPLTRLYLLTLLLLLCLLGYSLWQAEWTLAVGAGVAALLLVVDSVVATKLNVPINAQMDRWTVNDIPADWQTFRARWNSAFAIRRAVLLAGFSVFSLCLVCR